MDWTNGFSRKAAKECSPRRKPWEPRARCEQAPEGAKETAPRTGKGPTSVGPQRPNYKFGFRGSAILRRNATRTEDPRIPQVTVIAPSNPPQPLCHPDRSRSASDGGMEGPCVADQKASRWRARLQLSDLTPTIESHHLELSWPSDSLFSRMFLR